MKVKIILLFLLCLAFPAVLPAQDCFQDFMKRGIEAYGLFQFQKAIDLFNAAKICPNNTTDHIEQIDEWISKSNNGYINEITKARDEALVLQKEALKQARFSEANRLAYLAAQELEKRNLSDALLLAYTGLNMVSEEPLPQVKQIFGNVVASTNALKYRGHQKAVLNVGFLNNERLWSRSDDQSLIIWDNQGTPDTVLGISDVRMTCVQASPDGQSIAAGFENGKLARWNESGISTGYQPGNGAAVTSIAFSNDGMHVASTYRDGLIKIWSAKFAPLAVSNRQGSAIREVQFSGDGKFLVTRLAAPEVALLDLNGGSLGQIRHQKHIYSVKLSPDQQKILTCSADSTVRLSNTSGETLIVLAHPAKVHQAIFSPDDEKVLTADLDGNIRLWDLAGKELWSSNSGETNIESIQFSPDGKYFFSFGRNHIARLWTMGGKLLANLDRHTGSILGATFSPDSKFIVTASADHTAKLWDINGQLLMNADQFTSQVTCASFSSDGKRILTAAQDGSLTVLENPVYVFDQLQKNPPVPTEEQRVRFGINPP